MCAAASRARPRRNKPRSEPIPPECRAARGAAGATGRPRAERLWCPNAVHPGGLAPGATRTGAEDLHGVAEVHEPVCGGDPLRPTLHRRPGHLHRVPAGPAHQVVMVLLAAPPVQVFTAGGAHHVHLTGVRQPLQGAVDGGEPDPLAPLAQHRVQFLRGVEALDLVQQVAHCRPLPGVARRRGVGGHVALTRTGVPAVAAAAGRCSAAWLTASATMCATCSSTREYAISRPRREPRTTPAPRSTRRCWLTSGWATPSASTSSWTHRWPPASSVTIAIRTGAASARSSSPAASYAPCSATRQP